MTFYEAALEVLRRAAAPLHFKQITEIALSEGLLSHVGRVPEQTMQTRLLAMARRDEGRSVVVIEPGVFGLADWGFAHDDSSAEETEPAPPPEGPPLRPPERTPITLQDARAVRDAERQGKFEVEDREARTRSRRRRRRPKPGESPAEALANMVKELGGGPIDLQYAVDAIPRQTDLPEAFPTDLQGMRSLAEAENDRRADAGEPPLFVLDGDRVTLLERPEQVAVPEAAPVAGVVRDPRDVARALTPHLAKLEPEQVERMVLRVAAAKGFSDAKVAKRSAKGSPLFTGFMRIGLVQLRVAVRILVSGRNVRPDDVDELRQDLEHYSAAAGVIVTTGSVDRSVRGRAEDMAQKPVALFDGESLAGLCMDTGIGVRIRHEPIYEIAPGELDVRGRGG